MPVNKMDRPLKNIALIIALGTLLSKAGGLIRQLFIAGAFGVGIAYDAYNYAYVIPGFFLVLIGGVNGPFHNAIVNTLSNRNKKESSYILSAINTKTSIFLLIISLLLFIFSNNLISLIAPGLNPDIHSIAVKQLKIMSPIALISGLIGISFGALNAKEEFFLPSIAPLASSGTIILFIGLFWATKGNEIDSLNYSVQGGLIIASATLIGSIIQWTIQIPKLIKRGLLSKRLIFDFNHPGVKEVFKILLPATLSSGMLQINVFTDLFFASGIIGAAAGLGYANFLVQTPLGLISNSLLLPLLPTFSKLEKTKNKAELIKKLKTSIIFSMITMVGLGSLFIGSSHSIVEIIYKRGAFDNNAVNLVSGILIIYGLGMPAYLIRDLLVRVFYSINEATIPFKLSIIGIFLNIFFDWLLIGAPTPSGDKLSINFGVLGLVFATVLVNIFTCICLFYSLRLKIKLTETKELLINILKIIFSGIMSTLVGLSINNFIDWGNIYMGTLIEVIFSTISTLYVFYIVNNLLGIDEIQTIKKILFKKLTPHSN